MVSRSMEFCYVVIALLPVITLSYALIDENLREERGFDSLIGGGLGRDLSHTLRKTPLTQRSRMDSLTGFGLGRSFDNDYALYQYPVAPWMVRPYGGPSEVSKRGFDAINTAGFGTFQKRNFDKMDRTGFGTFSKRNFDKMDRPGFGEISKRDMGKRNFDAIDRPGFGSFSRRR